MLKQIPPINRFNSNYSYIAAFCIYKRKFERLHLNSYITRNTFAIQIGIDGSNPVQMQRVSNKIHSNEEVWTNVPQSFVTFLNPSNAYGKSKDETSWLEIHLIAITPTVGWGTKQAPR